MMFVVFFKVKKKGSVSVVKTVLNSQTRKHKSGFLWQVAA